MNKIINSLAICWYNEDINAIEIDFKGAGDIYTYNETMKIALDMAASYGVNTWLFKKFDFKDISTDQFLEFTKRWLSFGCRILKANQLAEKCQAVIITKMQAIKKINHLMKYDNLFRNKMNKNIKIQVTSNVHDVYHELKKGKSLVEN